MPGGWAWDLGLGLEEMEDGRWEMGDEIPGSLYLHYITLHVMDNIVYLCSIFFVRC